MVNGLCLNVFSQYDLQFESFSEDTKNIEARRKPKLDQNGDPTAILKIRIPMLQDAIVSSPLKVGDEDYRPGELVVFLGDGTKKITVKHPDFNPFEYNFPYQLKGKSTYNLVLKLPSEYLSAGKVSVKLNINVLKAKLNLDNGDSFQTDNGQFLIRLKPGTYGYTLSTSLPGYQELVGNLDITEDDLKKSGRLDEYLQLQSNKKSNLHISMVGNSTVKIDGKMQTLNKGAILMSLGRHYVEVESAGYKKIYSVDLINDNEYLDADIRVPLTIVSPVKAEFTIKPIGNALKSTVDKFKAGQKVRILGTYSVTAKAKGYPDKVFEVTAFPDDKELRMAIPMVSYADMLQYGINKKQDIKKAAKEYEKQIDSGDDIAMFEYGKILISSNRGDRGSKLIQSSIDLGNPNAALYGAAELCKGDKEMMKKYLQKALEGGNQKAHQFLGDIYSTYPADPGKAFDEYALYNTPYSRIRRAQIVLYNPDLKKADPTDIVELLKTIESSDRANYSQSQQLLGEMAYRGFGIKKDLKLATEYWEKADKSSLTQDNLLVMAVVHLNDEQLEEYMEKINLDSYDKNFMIYNGVKLIDLLTSAGHKLDKKNGNLAFKLFRKAFDLEDRSQKTLSYLGKYYKEGKVTTRDETTAKKYLQMAIEKHKDVRSMRWIGNIYENEKDFVKAKKYYKMAMDNNDIFAKGFYATLLFSTGGKKRNDQAEKLWIDAAKAGHQSSIRNLVEYYEKVMKDPSKATYWNNQIKK